MSLSLGTLEIGLGLNTSQYDAGIKSAKDQLSSLERRVTKLGTTPLKIKVSVDDRQLYGLNSHLLLKRVDLKKTVDFYKANPIKVFAEDDALVSLNQELRELKKLSVEIRTPSKIVVEHRFSGYQDRVEKAIERLSVTVRNSAPPKKNIFEKAFNLTVGNAVSGFFTGTGLYGGLKTGKGITKKSGIDFEESGEAIGKNIRRNVSQFNNLLDVTFKDLLGFPKGSKSAKQLLRVNFRAITDTILNPETYKKLESLYVEAEQARRAGKELPDMSEKLKKLFPRLATAMEENLSRFMGASIRVAVQPLRIRKRIQLADSARAAEEVAQILKLSEKENKLISDKKTITLVTGGVQPSESRPGNPAVQSTYDLASTVQGLFPDSAILAIPNVLSNSLEELRNSPTQFIREQLLPIIEKNKELLLNFISDTDYQGILGAFKKVQPIDRVFQTNFEGFDKDAIMLAAKALNVAIANPEKEIALMGGSGGGFVVEEAIAILQQLIKMSPALKETLKNVKYGIGIGTPHTGLTSVLDPKSDLTYIAAMGNEDKVGITMFGRNFVPKINSKNPEQRKRAEEIYQTADIALPPRVLFPSDTQATLKGTGRDHKIGLYVAEMGDADSDFGLQLRERLNGLMEKTIRSELEKFKKIGSNFNKLLSEVLNKQSVKPFLDDEQKKFIKELETIQKSVKARLASLDIIPVLGQAAGIGKQKDLQGAIDAYLNTINLILNNADVPFSFLDPILGDIEKLERLANSSPDVISLYPGNSGSLLRLWFETKENIFRAMGDQFNDEWNEFIKAIDKLSKSGYEKQFGAKPYHHTFGEKANQPDSAKYGEKYSRVEDAPDNIRHQVTPRFGDILYKLSQTTDQTGLPLVKDQTLPDLLKWVNKMPQNTEADKAAKGVIQALIAIRRKEALIYQDFLKRVVELQKRIKTGDESAQHDYLKLLKDSPFTKVGELMDTAGLYTDPHASSPEFKGNKRAVKAIEVMGESVENITDFFYNLTNAILAFEASLRTNTDLIEDALNKTSQSLVSSFGQDVKSIKYQLDIINVNKAINSAQKVLPNKVDVLKAEKVGQGFTGAVYRVDNLAIKIPSTELNRGKLGTPKEFQAQLAMANQGLAPRPITIKKGKFFIQEFIKSQESLNTLLRQIDTSTEDGIKVFTEYVKRYGKMLKKLHESGYVHLDYNTENALVGLENDLKVIDFANAQKLTGTEPENQALINRDIQWATGRSTIGYSEEALKLFESAFKEGYDDTALEVNDPKFLRQSASSKIKIAENNLVNRPVKTASPDNNNTKKTKQKTEIEIVSINRLEKAIADLSQILEQSVKKQNTEKDLNDAIKSNLEVSGNLTQKLNETIELPQEIDGFIKVVDAIKSNTDRLINAILNNGQLIDPFDNSNIKDFWGGELDIIKRQRKEIERALQQKLLPPSPNELNKIPVNPLPSFFQEKVNDLAVTAKSRLEDVLVSRLGTPDKSGEIQHLSGNEDFAELLQLTLVRELKTAGLLLSKAFRDTSLDVVKFGQVVYAVMQALERPVMALPGAAIGKKAIQVGGTAAMGAAAIHALPMGLDTAVVESMRTILSEALSTGGTQMLHAVQSQMTSVFSGMPFGIGQQLTTAVMQLVTELTNGTINVLASGGAITGSSLAAGEGVKKLLGAATSNIPKLVSTEEQQRIEGKTQKALKAAKNKADSLITTEITPYFDERVFPVSNPIPNNIKAVNPEYYTVKQLRGLARDQGINVPASGVGSKKEEIWKALTERFNPDQLTRLLLTTKASNRTKLGKKELSGFQIPTTEIPADFTKRIGIGIKSIGQEINTTKDIQSLERLYFQLEKVKKGITALRANPEFNTTGINKSLSGFLQSVDNLQTQILTKSGLESGKDYQQGLKLGLSGDSAQKIAHQNALKIVNATDKGLGNASPSKKGKKSGKDYIKGVEIGVEEQSKSLLKKVSDIANKTVFTFTDLTQKKIFNVRTFPSPVYRRWPELPAAPKTLPARNIPSLQQASGRDSITSLILSNLGLPTIPLPQKQQLLPTGTSKSIPALPPAKDFAFYFNRKLLADLEILSQSIRETTSIIVSGRNLLALPPAQNRRMIESSQKLANAQNLPSSNRVLIPPTKTLPDPFRTPIDSIASAEEVSRGLSKDVLQVSDTRIIEPTKLLAPSKNQLLLPAISSRTQRENERKLRTIPPESSNQIIPSFGSSPFTFEEYLFKLVKKADESIYQKDARQFTDPWMMPIDSIASAEEISRGFFTKAPQAIEITPPLKQLSPTTNKLLLEVSSRTQRENRRASKMMPAESPKRRIVTPSPEIIADWWDEEAQAVKKYSESLSRYLASVVKEAEKAIARNSRLSQKPLSDPWDDTEKLLKKEISDYIDVYAETVNQKLLSPAINLGSILKPIGNQNQQAFNQILPFNQQSKLLPSRNSIIPEVIIDKEIKKASKKLEGIVIDVYAETIKEFEQKALPSATNFSVPNLSEIINKSVIDVYAETIKEFKQKVLPLTTNSIPDPLTEASTGGAGGQPPKPPINRPVASPDPEPEPNKQVKSASEMAREYLEDIKKARQLLEKQQQLLLQRKKLLSEALPKQSTREDILDDWNKKRESLFNTLDSIEKAGISKGFTENFVNGLKAAIANFDGFINLLSTGGKALRTLDAELNAATGGMINLRKGAMAAIGGFALFKGAEFLLQPLFFAIDDIPFRIQQAVTDSLLSFTELQRIKLNLNLAGVGNVEQSLDALVARADRLGISFKESAIAYSRFKLITTGSPLQAQADNIFEGFQEALAARQTNAQQQAESFRAIGQIASKSVVSVEEFTQQLSESGGLNDALNVAARSIGLTTAQFYQQASAGNLLVQDVLPRLAAEYKRMSAGGLSLSTETLQSEISRFQNNTEQLQMQLGEKSAVVAYPALQALNAVLSTLNDNLGAVVSVGAAGLLSVMGFLGKSVMQFAAAGRLGAVVSAAMGASLQAAGVASLSTATAMGRLKVSINLATLAGMGLIKALVIPTAVIAGIQFVYSALNAGSEELKQAVRTLEESKKALDAWQNKTDSNNRKGLAGSLTDLPDMQLSGVEKFFNFLTLGSVYNYKRTNAIQGLYADIKNIDKSLATGVGNLKEYQNTLSNFSGSKQFSSELQEIRNNLALVRAERTIASAKGNDRSVAEFNQREQDLMKQEQELIDKQLGPVGSRITADLQQYEMALVSLEKRYEDNDIKEEQYKNRKKELVTIIGQLKKAEQDYLQVLKDQEKEYRKLQVAFNLAIRTRANANFTNEGNSLSRSIGLNQQFASGKINEFQFNVKVQEESLQTAKERIATLENSANSVSNTLNERLSKSANKVLSTYFKEDLKQLNVASFGEAIAENLLSPDAIQQIMDQYESDLKDNAALKDILNQAKEYATARRDILNTEKEIQQISREIVVERKKRQIQEKQASGEIVKAEQLTNLANTTSSSQNINYGLEQTKINLAALYNQLAIEQEKLVLNVDDPLTVKTAIANITQQIAETGLSLRDQQEQIQDYYRNLDRQIVDFNRQIEDYRRQIEDAQLSAFKENRSLSESYSDLVRELDKNLLNAQNQLLDTTDRIRVQQVKNRLLIPGTSEAGKELGDIFLEFVQGQADLASRGRTFQSRTEEIETSYISTLRNIRNLQEQQQEAERNRLRTIEDIKRTQENLNRTLADLIRQTNKELGFIPQSIKDIVANLNTLPEPIKLINSELVAIPPDIKTSGEDLVKSIEETAEAIRKANEQISQTSITGQFDSNLLSVPFLPKSRNGYLPPPPPSLSIPNGLTRRGQELSQHLDNPHVKAFLDVIAYAEGTANMPNKGYNTLFGHGQFSSFADHPRQRIPFGSTSSSASGRYQIMDFTWDEEKSKLGLKDFSPVSQDLVALSRILMRGGLDELLKGDIRGAINATRKEWASFPGANYPGQGMKRMEDLLKVYEQSLRKYQPNAPRTTAELEALQYDGNPANSGALNRVQQIRRNQGGQGANVPSQSPVAPSAFAIPKQIQSVLVQEVGGKTVFSKNANTPPASPASTIKLIVADILSKEIKKGTIGLKDQITIKQPLVDPHGTLKSGNKRTVQELLDLMLRVSDNTATNVLIDLMGGLQSVTNKAQQSGYTATTLSRYLNIPGSSPANRSNAVDTTRAMQAILSDNSEAGQLAEKSIRQTRNFKFSGELGGKIGNNSKVIGNVGIVVINGKEYIVTAYANVDGNILSNRGIITNTTNIIKDTLERKGQGGPEFSSPPPIAQLPTLPNQNQDNFWDADLPPVPKDNPINFQSPNLPPVPKLPTDNLGEAAGQLRNAEIADQNSQEFLRQLESSFLTETTLDRIIKFGRQQEEEARNLNRTIRDASESVTDLTINSKGYLTVQEEINKSATEVSRQYRSQIESLQDQRRNLEYQADGWQKMSENIKKGVAEQIILGQIPADVAEQLLKNADALAERAKSAKEQVEILDQAIEQLGKNQGVATLEASFRRTRDTVRSIRDRMNDLTIQRMKLENQSRPTLFDDSAILAERISLQKEKEELEDYLEPYKDLPQYAEYVANIRKEWSQIAELRLERAELDASPNRGAAESFFSDIREGKGIGSAFSSLGMNIMTKFVEGITKPAIDALTSAIDGFTKPITQAFESLFNSITGPVGNFFTNALSSIFKPVGNIFSSIFGGGGGGGLFNGLLSGITGIFSGGLGGLGSIGSLGSIGASSFASAPASAFSLGTGFSLFSDGGKVGKANAPIEKNIISAFQRERAMSGGRKPRLIVANEDELVLNPKETEAYLEYRNNAPIKNYANGGFVGGKPNYSTTSNNNNSNQSLVINNTNNVTVESRNDMGYSLNQLKERENAQNERTKKRFFG